MNPDTDLERLLAEAQACVKTGGHAQGAVLAEQAAALAERLARPQPQAQALRLAALHRLRVGELDKAVHHARAALSVADTPGDPAGQADAHGTLALAYTQAHLPQDALAHALEASRCASASGNPRCMVMAASRLAMAYVSVGERDKAMEIGRNAVAQARALGDPEERFRTLNNLVFDLCNEASEGKPLSPAQWEEVAHLAREARDLAVEQGNPTQQVLAGTHLGRVLVAQGHLAAALPELTRSVALAERQGYTWPLWQARLNRAECLQALGRLEDAGAELRHLLDGPAENLPGVDLSLALYRLSKQRGDLAAALQHHEAYHRAWAAEQAASVNLQSRLMAMKFDLQAAEHRAQRAALEAEALRTRAEALDLTAQTDPLTGLYNRRHLDTKLPLLAQRARQQHLPLAAAMFDADHFKQVNDRFGHAVGDQVLVALARLFGRAVRAGDLVVRLGGEEFLVLYVDSTAAQAAEAAQRARQLVQEHPWSQLHPQLQVTVSAGVGALQPGEPLPQWLEQLDQCLYQAKAAGRNRVFLRAAQADPEA